MAVKERAERWIKEYGPGGDPEAAFYAGARFAYRDAARGMGRAGVDEDVFQGWVKEMGFSPVAGEEIRKIYGEEYDG
jgi:hypothetical protein